MGGRGRGAGVGGPRRAQTTLLVWGVGAAGLLGLGALWNRSAASSAAALRRSSQFESLYREAIADVSRVTARAEATAERLAHAEQDVAKYKDAALKCEETKASGGAALADSEAVSAQLRASAQELSEKLANAEREASEFAETNAALEQKLAEALEAAAKAEEKLQSVDAARGEGVADAQDGNDQASRVVGGVLEAVEAAVNDEQRARKQYGNERGDGGGTIGGGGLGGDGTDTEGGEAVSPKDGSEGDDIRGSDDPQEAAQSGLLR